MNASSSINFTPSRTRGRPSGPSGPQTRTIKKHFASDLTKKRKAAALAHLSRRRQRIFEKRIPVTRSFSSSANIPHRKQGKATTFEENEIAIRDPSGCP